MSVEELLKTVQFVVDQDGKPSGVVLDIHVWEILLTLLEEVADRELVHDRLKTWRAKTGWTHWEEFETELDKDAVPVVG